MKALALTLGTWKVRTMTPGFSDDLQEVNDARKTAVIDRELSRLQMDIVALPPRKGICGGERLHPILAGQAIRLGQRTRCGIRSQKQIIGVNNPTSRRNRANPVSPTPNILRTSQSDQCLCINFGIHSRSKRQGLWRLQCCHKENSWQRFTVHRRRFQRQSRCWSQLLAHLLGSVQHWKNEWEWPAPVRALLSSWVVCQ